VHAGVLRLCQCLHELPETDVQVLGLVDEFTADDLGGWSPIPTHVFRHRGPRNFGYAPGLKQKLLELDADVLMTHGLWMYPSVVAQGWHRHTQRPFILNPHGMLEPWALRQSPIKKRLASVRHEKGTLQSATALRALCREEVRSFREYGLRNPACVLPNGVDLPDTGPLLPAPWEDAVPEGAKVLLYLGRLHPKKGLANLLRAWALFHARRHEQRNDWRLVIAGWDQGGHEAELKRLAEDFDVRTTVHFAGPLFDDARAAAFSHARAFVLPSHSEGLPMTVLEAWSHRLPAIITPECHLPEGYGARAAIYARPQISSLVRSLEQLFALTPTERMQMGHRGRELVEQRFSWPDIARQFRELCEWSRGRAEPPRCLVTEENSAHEPVLI
jgi:poly(glycerol-phosphate) alpha-glucosyltransferase